MFTRVANKLLTLTTLALIVIAGAGCNQVDGYRAIQKEFPGCRLDRPRVMDVSYGWVMQDATGSVWWVEHNGINNEAALCTYLFPPLVVTQYVDRVVTQECQRQHWPEPGQAIHEPCNNIYCEQCRPRGRIWGVGPVPYDWVMGTNGFMVPPGSPEAWPTNNAEAKTKGEEQ